MMTETIRRQHAATSSTPSDASPYKMPKLTEMDLPVVHRDQPLPLYHQIFLRLRDEIVRGDRAYGSRLPTEKELAEGFAVSRITARRALDELARTQLVERRRRIGTHVTFQTPTRPIEGNLGQALDTLIFFGRNTKVNVLSVEHVPALAAEADLLKVNSGECLIRAERIRLLDDEPLGHLISHVPVALGVAITAEALRATPMLTMIEHAGVAIGEARQRISAVLANGAMSQHLDVPIGAPILQIRRILYDQSGCPIQLVTAHYRGDRYQISLALNSAG